MSQAVTVLVVDDDADLRDMIVMMLVDDGYHVDTASNGAEALRQANLHQPDAVILDSMMPVLSGWGFLAQWQERPTARRAPVLVMSAVHNARRAMEAGAQGFLAKPFDLDVLEAALARIL